MFSALGEVVCRMISPALREHEHICWSNEDVLRLARNVRVTSRSILLKYDVKEFYLSGGHEQLNQNACNVVQGHWSKWLGA